MTYKHNKTWRKKHPGKRHAQTKRYFRKTAWARNHGVKWTEDHIDYVLYHAMPDSELSVIIGRSVAAIQKVRSVYG